jgi:PHP family Zn ribbon phosphoesterase
LLAQFHGKAVASKKIWEEYNKLVTEKTTEFDILLNMPITEIAEKTSQEFADILAKNRVGHIEVKGGYDGVYGVPLLTEQDIAENKKQEVTIKKQQKGLGEFF